MGNSQRIVYFFSTYNGIFNNFVRIDRERENENLFSLDDLQ